MKPGRKKKGPWAAAVADAEARTGIGRKGFKGTGRRPIPSSLSPGAELEVMTLHEVADYLNCHYGTAFNLAHRRDIPSFRLGGNWRFLKSEVDKWIAKGGGRRPSEELAVKPKRKLRPRSPGTERK